MSGHDANRKANIRKAFLLSREEVEIIIHALRSKAGDEQSREEYRNACFDLAQEFKERTWPDAD